MNIGIGTLVSGIVALVAIFMLVLIVIDLFKQPRLKDVAQLVLTIAIGSGALWVLFQIYPN